MGQDQRIGWKQTVEISNRKVIKVAQEMLLVKGKLITLKIGNKLTVGKLFTCVYLL